MDQDAIAGQGDDVGSELDAFRSHPEWTEAEIDAALDRFVERFPVARVVDAVQARLNDLSGPDAEVLFRLVEAHPGTGLPHALAKALESQTDLPVVRLWGALDVLDRTGVIGQYPELGELLEELVESFDENDVIAELADQIENDKDGIWMALQALSAVEFEIRPHIVEGLAEAGQGPGIIEFLRLLAYSDEPGSRVAALHALEAAEPSAEISAAWTDIAARHPDAGVRRRVSAHLAKHSELAVASSDRDTGASLKRVQRSFVTAVGGDGRATIGISSALAEGAGRATAVFVCDVVEGVVEVHGNIVEKSARDTEFEAILGGVTDEMLVDEPRLALALLAGCLTLSNPATSPALRYWVEATAGPELKPIPFRAEFPGWDPAERLKDQDIDGVHAEVLYGTLGMRLFRVTDAELQRAIFSVYNDWLAEFCAYDPKRLIGTALISLAAIPLSFVSPWIASGLYIFVALLWLVPDRRIERVLVKQEKE